VIGRVTDDKTQILFKILEFSKNAPNPEGILSLLNLSGSQDYQMLYPLSNGLWSGAQNAQIQEGIQLMRSVVQQAINKS